MAENAKKMSMAKVPMAKLGPLMGLLGLGVGGIMLASNSFYTVPAGHKGLIFSRLSGVRSFVYGEGIHFKIPWLEREITYNARNISKRIQCNTGSKDLQMVDITVGVLARPDVARLPVIYQRLGKDYLERVLPSIATEVVKSVVAQFTASELITNRTLVSQKISNRLVQRARDFGILLENVVIVSTPVPS